MWWRARARARAVHVEVCVVVSIAGANIASILQGFDTIVTVVLLLPSVLRWCILMAVWGWPCNCTMIILHCPFLIW